MIRIAATVTFYNPDQEIIKNMKSYIDSVEKVYIIDNSSNDNIKLIPNNKKIVYIANNKNLGVASALNIAANMAIDDGYNWLLTMDQDSEFKDDNLKKMISYLEKNENKLNDIGLISPWHVIKTGIKKPTKEMEDVVEVMTSGNIINLLAYKEIGGYKDWLFIDGIDFEYCMNLNVNGYKVRRLNFCELEHKLGDIKIKHVLNRNFVCSNHNYIRRYYMSRNNHYIYDMYYNYFPDYCTMIIKGLNGQFRNILFFEKDKFRKLRNMIRGYRDYKKGVKGEYKYID